MDDYQFDENEKYIFVSYAHRDNDLVLPVIKGLQRAGFRVWYDAGIEAGAEWPEYVAERLYSAEVVLIFLSQNALNSHNCVREIHFAINKKKKILVIHLEDLKLSLGMEMQLGPLQAMFYRRFTDVQTFLQSLLGARILQECKQKGARANEQAKSPEPVHPARSAVPVEPVAPDESIALVEPVTPAESVQPARPAAAPRTVTMSPRARVLTRNEPVEEKAKPILLPFAREYCMPHIELLMEDTSVQKNDYTEDAKEKIAMLVDTLKNFNIRVKEQVNYSRGPTFTRYELRPEIGVSVRSVMNRADDISLSMAAPVRIALIPDKAAIGVEVPNAEREMVFMRTLLESEAYKNSTNPLEIPLGIDVEGAVQMCNLAKMPHLLVAGSTGSGKSVCINTILISLMYKTSPADLRLILIDPKRVEFCAFVDEPHLLTPVITDCQRAIATLKVLTEEMERRYELMKRVGVRDIDRYNRAAGEQEHMPYIVAVIDELFDLKLCCPNNDVENYICRLAQKARAAGMHLIIGTQRPTVNVITGNLKNNIPSRIAFKVTQQTDSRTILDANGAEQLIGRGDMLYMTAGLSKLNRVQGAFVSDEEVEAVADYIRDHNDEVQYNQAFMDQIEAELARAAAANRKDDDGDFGDDDGGDEDPKFREAVELAIETQKVATSLLQRRFGIGYSRAAKIVDRMEALGYIGAYEGNKPRRVLITPAQWKEIKKN